jgi:trehalose 6-phosphate synthase
MNLVVKEWAIASERPGVAIISETAGVASEMGASALLVSPLDIEGASEAMAWALDMPMAEREARLARLRKQAESWTAGHWLSAQLTALKIVELDQKDVSRPDQNESIETRFLAAQYLLGK